MVEKPTERIFKKGVVLKLSPGDKEKLDVARKNLIPKPATAKGLRDDLARGFEKLTIFDNRPRSDFYTVSNANVTQDKPILMDAFTYCENDHLHLDAIFNIKYFVVTMKKRVAYKSLDDLWSAEYRGVVVRNEMKKDNHKHTIVGTFTFPFGCDRHDGNFTVFSNSTHFSYSFAPSFIPSFTTPRYYLSACTSIDFSPHFQVLTWINHHYYEGVQHFTFYLNGRVADWQRLLRPYVEKGLVDVVEYTYPNHRFLFEQNSALNACHRRYRYASRFVLYNDVDEFMLPLNRTWRLVDVVRLYDTSFPQAEAFRVFNTFHSCRNYSYYMWGFKRDIRQICPLRAAKITREGRWKNIVRADRTPLVQVHHVSYGDSVLVDHKKDMVMLHFKMGWNKRPGVAYELNPIVEEGVKYVL
ncbi:hypothetical protein AV274_4674 [Blastocystis sp. ATCC 50177/Nand II]|uniref:Glycosyltransferase family 92 protein n=1 Tax=Blastocystis sp. subtype 1 (strain ATCC 50177 / NandII) TaxID=478820 RepID=A0A196S9A4_BLAHN|nr:hypothetical protein AV274_4674 [Blastocystis sp. ATCC 50177/Nand II]